MANAVVAVIGAALLAWMVTAWREKSGNGLTYYQALGFTLLKFIFGFRLSGFDRALLSGGPSVYLLPAQSHLDEILLRSSLAAGTFHVDTGEGETHALQVLKSALVGKASVCVYLPREMEFSAATLALLAEIGVIAREAGARIVPLYIRGTRYSIFSRWSTSQAPRSLLPQLAVSAAPPFFLAGVDDARLADALADGLALARFRSANFSLSMPEALVAAARLYGANRPIVEDSTGASLSYRQLLRTVRILAKTFGALSPTDRPVGLMLPNSAAVAVSFFATLSAGRIPAMLNFSAGPAIVQAAVKTAAVATVVTSRQFVEKADLGTTIDRLREGGTTIVYLEDLRRSLGLFDKLSGILRWRRPLVERNAEDPAVILFTSGSEGTPKGVVLSARNLIANAAQAESRIDISAEDTLFNVLPVFHSFGLLAGLIMPIFYGVRIYLYPSPLHYRIIPGLARKVRPTILLGTDNFLRGYGRTARNEDFSSLRLIVAGAESVNPETRRLYQERFGAEIIEGYGLTEASPVVAVASSGDPHPGSVGKLLPGMEMQIVPVAGIDLGGKLLIAGPNIMQGYLRITDPGVLQPLESKWHDTGDIVSIDPAGNITITGRVSRFAKLAGEMVSLEAVELLAQGVWPSAEHAVVRIADAVRGERIVLLTTEPGANRQALAEEVHRAGKSNLMVPHDVVVVPRVPLLASGKTDYVAASRLAIRDSS